MHFLKHTSIAVLLLACVAAKSAEVIKGKVPDGNMRSTVIYLDHGVLDIDPRGWQGSLAYPCYNTWLADDNGLFESEVCARTYYVESAGGRFLWVTLYGTWNGQPAVAYVGLTQYSKPISYQVSIYY